MQGDFDGDVDVDDNDLLIWSTYFGLVDPIGRPVKEIGDADADLGDGVQDVATLFSSNGGGTRTPDTNTGESSTFPSRRHRIRHTRHTFGPNRRRTASGG